jgi:serine/threonine protein kinase/formylglycine-generating enzyme required for sulfatase activity
MEPPVNSRQVPFHAGRYRCEAYLGGGMADVYRARDTELPRDVAIKILKPSNQDDPEVRECFLDEVQLASRCSHENIVSTYDKGEFEGSPFIVMEFLRGERLDKLIHNGGQGDFKHIVNIALQIARAMEYVHLQGIVHRDLKPQNLHVDEHSRVKLVDFGIAKSVEWNKTQAGLVKGTAYYMAPEQILGNPVTFRTDIWAFGVVLYEMLCAGRRPFQGSTLDTLWAAIANGTPDYQLLTDAGVPASLQQIVKRCLEKQPEVRFQSFSEVCEALRNFASPARTEPASVVAPVPSGKNRVGVWLGAALLGVAGIAFWLFNRTPASKPLSKPGTDTGGAVAVGTVTPSAPPPPRALTLDTGDMVLVDAGSALLGADAKPVDVNVFYLDSTEVTNGSYLKFCQQTNYVAPPNAQKDPADYPVVNVSFYDAEAYAHWAKKRLPTAAEWEKAARGAKGQQFPWGNEWREDAANIPRDKDARKTAGLSPANSFSSGASPYGALNLVGNAWEWVNAPAALDDHQFEMLQKLWKVYSPPLSRTEAFYQVRGGSFHYLPFGPKSDLVVDSLTMPARAREPDIGFRCAKDP